MRPLHWEQTARTPLTESLHLFTGAETPRTTATSAFGKHLYQSSGTTPSAPPEPMAPPERSVPPRPASAPPPSASSESSRVPPRSQSPEGRPPAASNRRPTEEPSKTAQPPGESPPRDVESSEQGSTPSSAAAPAADRAVNDEQQQPEAIAAVAMEAAATAAHELAVTLSAADPEEEALPTPGSEESEEQTEGPVEATEGIAALAMVALPTAAPGPVSMTQEVDSGTVEFVTTETEPLREGTDGSPTDLTAAAAEMNPISSALSLSSGEGDQDNSPSSRGSRTSSPGRESARINPAEVPKAALPNQATTPTAPLIQQLDDAAVGVPSPGQHQNANSAGVLRGGEANSLSDTGPQLRFAQHLAAKPGARVGKTSPLTDLEHVRLVDRVARAFQTAEARGGTVTLRLHPPELGALRVELRVTDGVLSARLEAETPAARTILLENVQVLHDRLAEQGMRIERFDVDLLDHRPPGDSSGFEQPRSRDQESRQQSHSNGNQPDSHEAESPRMGTRGGSTGNLNIIV